MSTKTEYEIFGPEWKKEVSKMPKALIIKMWADDGQIKAELLEALEQFSMLNEDHDAFKSIKGLILNARQVTKKAKGL